jgi:hypothetical protein
VHSVPEKTSWDHWRWLSRPLQRRRRLERGRLRLFFPCHCYLFSAAFTAIRRPYLQLHPLISAPGVPNHNCHFSFRSSLLSFDLLLRKVDSINGAFAFIADLLSFYGFSIISSTAVTFLKASLVSRRDGGLGLGYGPPFRAPHLPLTTTSTTPLAVSTPPRFVWGPRLSPRFVPPRSVH